MRFLYALAVFALLSSSAFAQRNSRQVDAELVINGSAALDATIFNFNPDGTLPGVYFPQPEGTLTPQGGTSLFLGLSVFFRVGAPGDTTDLGVVYTSAGTTAQAVVARKADGTPAIGCSAGAAVFPPVPDWVNQSEFAGKIVMIRRGLCPFIFKAYAGQLAGAVGVLIFNGADRKGPTGDLRDTMPNLGSAPEYTEGPLTIPVAAVPNGIGQPIVDEIDGGGTVLLTIRARGAVAAEPTAGTTISGLEVRGANPFAVSTTLRVYTEQTEAVRVDVYNVRGQQVATLFNGAVAGERTVTLSSAALAPGVYFVRATGETFRSQQQVTVVR